ncbi:MAG: polyprenyl synthetase family protein [Pyrinomonadaceae bacterium]
MKASFDTRPTPLSGDDEMRQAIAARRAAVELCLDRLVPAESVEPSIIHAAIRWSLFAGGKRFRPLLLLFTGEALGASQEQMLSTACAFELLHTYSLIHDDLPSMDDDELRRGKPTCHIQFGEATAILAGDALQALAFQTILETETLTAEVRVRVAAELARAAGTPLGMVAGQAEDLQAESKIISGDKLEAIHRRKTGALISAAARCGAIIAGASSSELEAITTYASRLGLLFQITDDLLDVTATAADLGKTPVKMLGLKSLPIRRFTE